MNATQEGQPEEDGQQEAQLEDVYILENQHNPLRDQIDNQIVNPAPGIAETNEGYSLEEAMPQTLGKYCQDRTKCETYKKLKSGEKCPIQGCGRKKQL